MTLSPYKVCVTIIPLLLGNGCTTMPSSALQYDSFAAYAEAVFRHQNSLTSHIMILSDSEAFLNNEALEKAEHSMNEACHLLNEYAEHEASGEAMGILFKHAVQNSIENCDIKVHQLETLLVNIEKTL